MDEQLVLVTGGNGFIASRLIPRLLSSGHRVRVMVRRPTLLAGRAWLPSVDVREGSSTDPESLADALKGVDTAYYLIHSMSQGRGYMEIERESARMFASAAEAAGVRHIIYLGGLADPQDPRLAPHMRSRIETGEILRHGRVPVTEFRAGVIAGAGSISFEMIRFLTETFPVLPGPAWLHNRSQPIASENIIDYLMAALDKTEARGGIYEMGGPEQMQYGQTMLRYARCRGLKRRLFTVPGIPICWMALLVDRLTPVPYPIASALVGGLQSDSKVTDDAARRMFPEIELIDYEAAVGAALRDLSPDRLERVWEGMGRDMANFRHEGFVIDHRRRLIRAPAPAVFEKLAPYDGTQRFPHPGLVRRLRGFLESPFAAPGEGGRRKNATRDMPSIGRQVDGYQVEALEPGRLVRLRSMLSTAGENWMEWRVEAHDSGRSILAQTAFFAPRGLPGFLYWWILGPLRSLTFGRLIDSIKRESEAP